MDQKQVARLIDSAKITVQKAGQELTPHFGKIEAEAKNDSGYEASDIVTRLDGETEELLAAEFKKIDPGIGFRGEEHGVVKDAEITWLVDPIDGTSHFVRGIPFCTNMVALIENNQVIGAIINDFVGGNIYHAVRGQGAFKNGQQIKVINRELNKSIVSFETRIYKPECYKNYLQVKEKIGGILHTVNCGFEFTMIASGKWDGRIALDPFGEDWDFAPGSLLVEEAGGMAVNHGSDSYDFRDHNYVIGTPNLVEGLTKSPDSIF